MVSAWLVAAERVTLVPPRTCGIGPGWLLVDVAVVVLELLLVRFCCCLVTSAVSWVANSLMRGSARICLSWRLSHSKMKWPSESAILALLQHGQPSAAMSLPIWYLAGFLPCCFRTCCHVWKVPCLLWRDGGSRLLVSDADRLGGGRLWQTVGVPTVRRCPSSDRSSGGSAARWRACAFCVRQSWRCWRRRRQTLLHSWVLLLLLP